MPQLLACAASASSEVPPIESMPTPCRPAAKAPTGERDDAGAKPNVARTLRGGRDEQLRAGDDLEAAGMMLADPRLVIIEPVEMDEKLHVAVEREQRVFGKRMKGSKKDAGFQKSVAHGGGAHVADASVARWEGEAAASLHGIPGRRRSRGYR